MDYEKCKKYALNLVNTRMYTCSEINERLLRKGADKENAERVVTELMTLGILDDRKYAEYYIEDAVRANKGVYRIKQELYKKGIASALIDELTKGQSADVFSALLEYARFKFGEKCEYSYKEYSNIKAHLARRGYSYGEIESCLEELEITYLRGEEY